MIISVIICTYNPRKAYLERVLEALKEQTLPMQDWELIMVDNNSDDDLNSLYDLSWHPNGRIVGEEKPGLANARICGVQESHGEILVFVDDDNVLKLDYLKQVLDILEEYSHIGAIGGKALAEYEAAPPEWFSSLSISLGCRDLGDDIHCTYFHKEQKRKDLVFDQYPAYAPIGTGMVIRREAFMVYLKEVQNDLIRTKLGRTGKTLLSGEDNDIVLTILKNGWDIGYFPALVVKHIIPAARLDKHYLSRMALASNRTWVMVLDVHGIRPWPSIPEWSKVPRKIKAYFMFKAWKNTVNYIRWKGICGRIEGQSVLKV